MLTVCCGKCHSGGFQVTTESWGDLIAGFEVAYCEETVSVLKGVQSGKCLEMQSWHGIDNSAEYYSFELRLHFLQVTVVTVVLPLPQCLPNMINTLLENLQNTRLCYENCNDNKTLRNQCYFSHFPVSLTVFREKDWHGHCWWILHSSLLCFTSPYLNSGIIFSFGVWHCHSLRVGLSKMLLPKCFSIMIWRRSSALEWMALVHFGSGYPHWNSKYKHSEAMWR